jgi:23S rRNA pseudouridine1911/1915/1917 synthase
MKPSFIELTNGEQIPILFEDRSVIALDKPAGWMLVPTTWQRTQHNLQAAIESSIAAGQFWARSRNLKFLRYIHRLDAETTGVLLFGKKPGAVRSYSELFESRRMEKVYLAVVESVPRQPDWVCRDKIGEESSSPKRMKIDPRHGKAAETHFKVLATRGDRTLVEARPVTGRTHQIRVHLAHAGVPVVGDALYGRALNAMALRSVMLAYRDPFTRKQVCVKAPVDEFLKSYNFSRDEIGSAKWINTPPSHSK